MSSAVVIVGGSHAGVALAAGLRKRDHTLSITLISNEAAWPYQRPPLSKKYLLGELPQERLLLRPAKWYDEQNITLVRDTSIVRIDRAQKRVEAADGRFWQYTSLALATGCRARALPESLHQGARNVLSIRHLSDITRLQALLHAGKRLVIIGGGYIGLEAAAVAREFDCAVTLIEAAPRILGRVAAEETAAYFRQLHQQHGVKIIEGVNITGFQCHQHMVQQVVLDNGISIAADIVIVGIGVEANTALAEQCGLTVEQGICVDAYGCTNDAAIYAAGDCTRFMYHDQPLRLESVQNAHDQADAVAANILGAATPYQPHPWFWSDQYHVTLQIAGLNSGYTYTVVRPGLKQGAQSVWYYRDQQLLAVDAMNDAPCYAAVKKVLERGGNIIPSMAQDMKLKPKDWLNSLSL